MSQKCVYFVGPGSTGKTTLAKAFAERCIPPTFMLSEVARTVLSKLKYTADDISNDSTKCYVLQKAILHEQWHQEKELLKTQKIFISDRCAVDPIVYAQFYIKDEKLDLLKSEKWFEMKLRYQNEKCSLIVLIEPNEAFLKNDGIRKMPIDLNDWKLFYQTYLNFMIDQDIPFNIIPSNVTDISDRMDLVIGWMEN